MAAILGDRFALIDRGEQFDVSQPMREPPQLPQMPADVPERNILQAHLREPAQRQPHRVGLKIAQAERGASESECVLTLPNIRGEKYVNPRTEMMRIIQRAGLTLWPKAFHNLWTSRETELAAEHPLHVVCEWIGNTPKVASEHCLRVTEADYRKATSTAAPGKNAPEDAQAAQKAAQAVSTRLRQRSRQGTALSGTIDEIIEKTLKKHGLVLQR